jgi:hypothetical protein
MTEKALKKIDGTIYQKTLEYKRNERKRLEAAGYETAESRTNASIAGYCQALCDCGIITERERALLFLYYGTT